MLIKLNPLYVIYILKVKNSLEFKLFLQKQDDTISIKNIDILYNPINNYLLYIKRKNLEDALYKYNLNRPENIKINFESKIKKYYELYTLNYDISILKII